MSSPSSLLSLWTMKRMDPQRLAAMIVSRRSKSTAAAVLPTRHSLQQPPRMCTDNVEQSDLTAQVLETPIGQLYTKEATTKTNTTGNTSSTLAQAYDVANPSTQLVEYLVLGYASSLPDGYYNTDENNSTSDDAAENLQQMKALVERLEQEGTMYLDLLQQEQKIAAAAENEEETAESDVEEDSSDLFAAPGPTTTMYDAILDGMASLDSADSGNSNTHGIMEYSDVAMKVLNRHDTNLQHVDNTDSDYSLLEATAPTMISYNAPLRGISQQSLQDEVQRDDALNVAFTLYNSLTHIPDLKRNASTMKYMLQIIHASLPASRIKGNISVSFWKQASTMGVVSDDVLKVLHEDIHNPPDVNGPEFQMFLGHITFDSSSDETKMPQRYRRFVNKYQHSEHY